jgi:hypothetical protein
MKISVQLNFQNLGGSDGQKNCVVHEGKMSNTELWSGSCKKKANVVDLGRDWKVMSKFDFSEISPEVVN